MAKKKKSSSKAAWLDRMSDGEISDLMRLFAHVEQRVLADSRKAERAMAQAERASKRKTSKSKRKVKRTSKPKRKTSRR